ncbi:MAG: peptidoglycan-binding domain-containing protein [Actinomycetota bacterium]|nr:peptidoglycan-binding domain-containing protein [Actinomycetota bacterium]
MTDDRWYSVARSVAHDAEESVDVEADLAALHQRLAGATVAPSSRDRRGSGRGRLLAVAATVLLIAGAAAVLLTRRDDPDSITTATVTNATVTTTTTTTPPPSSTTPGESENKADVEPASGAAGSIIRVTPDGAVERGCTDIAYLARLTVGGSESLGLVRGSQWFPYGPGETVTIPACIGETTAEPSILTVPSGLDDGTYRVCIGRSDSNPGAGCGLFMIDSTQRPTTTCDAPIIRADLAAPAAEVVDHLCAGDWAVVDTDPQAALPAPVIAHLTGSRWTVAVHLPAAPTLCATDLRAQGASPAIVEGLMWQCDEFDANALQFHDEPPSGPLRAGDRGIRVGELQEALAAEQLLEGAQVNGAFGAETRKAIITAQLAAGLELTAEADLDTLQLLGLLPESSGPSTATSANPAPSDGDEWLAIANPSVVAPGGAIHFAPSRVIERMCTDIAVLLRQTADGWEMMGQILRGIDWVPVVPRVPPTYPPCVGEYSAQALVLIMPTTIDDGTYLVCIGAGGLEEPAGCGRVAVEATTPAASP